jgi:hypothetical protein
VPIGPNLGDAQRNQEAPRCFLALLASILRVNGSTRSVRQIKITDSKQLMNGVQALAACFQERKLIHCQSKIIFIDSFRVKARLWTYLGVIELQREEGHITTYKPVPIFGADEDGRGSTLAATRENLYLVGGSSNSSAYIRVQAVDAITTETGELFQESIGGEDNWG